MSHFKKKGLDVFFVLMQSNRFKCSVDLLKHDWIKNERLKAFVDSCLVVLSWEKCYFTWYAFTKKNQTAMSTKYEIIIKE